SALAVWPAWATAAAAANRTAAISVRPMCDLPNDAYTYSTVSSVSGRAARSGAHGQHHRLPTHVKRVGQDEVRLAVHPDLPERLAVQHAGAVRAGGVDAPHLALDRQQHEVHARKVSF